MSEDDTVFNPYFGKPMKPFNPSEKIVELGVKEAIISWIPEPQVSMVMRYIEFLEKKINDRRG